jgi:hypothetical protein
MYGIFEAVRHPALSSLYDNTPASWVAFGQRQYNITVECSKVTTALYNSILILELTRAKLGLLMGGHTVLVLNNSIAHEQSQLLKQFPLCN